MNKNAFFMKAFCYNLLGEYDNGLREINRALKVDKKFADAYYIRALINVNLLYYKAAKTDCENAIKFGTLDYQTPALMLLRDINKKTTQMTE